VKGRERTYFEHFWNDFAADKARSIPERTGRPTPRLLSARTHGAGWAYFVRFHRPQGLRRALETKLPIRSRHRRREGPRRVLGEQAKLSPRM